MAKSKKVEVTESVTDEVVETTQTVVDAPETTFDERTAQGQPWRNEDGSENRGDVIESEPVVTGETTSETTSDEEPTE